LAVVSLSFAAMASGVYRSDAWRRNLHEVGESYPGKAKVLSLLGPPDRVEAVVVSSPEHYAPYQPRLCATPLPGTALQRWEYRLPDKKITHLLFFRGEAMVCFAGSIDGGPPEPLNEP
jgi:hypothetical protein